MCENIYKKLEILQAKSGEHIFHVNDIGDKFYVILQGK